MSTPQVIIRPSSKRHGQFLTLLGVALVLILFIWNLVAPLPLAVLIVTLSAAIVLSVIGIAKVLEPDAALTVTPQFICYQHRKGQWQLAWNNILRFDQPRIQRFLDLQDMPYVGFRLHSYHDFLGQISQRMAVHLMLEQRNLLVVALRYEKPNERDYAQYFDVPLKYKSNEGHVYEGVKAAFLLAHGAIGASYWAMTCISAKTHSIAPLMNLCNCCGNCVQPATIISKTSRLARVRIRQRIKLWTGKVITLHQINAEVF